MLRNATQRINDIANLSRIISIYIDSNLENSIKGEEYAKTLCKQGFKTIYLATGYQAEYFPAMPWITQIVGKEPVFL